MINPNPLAALERHGLDETEGTIGRVNELSKVYLRDLQTSSCSYVCPITLAVSSLVVTMHPTANYLVSHLGCVFSPLHVRWDLTLTSHMISTVELLYPKCVVGVQIYGASG